MSIIKPTAAITDGDFTIGKADLLYQDQIDSSLAESLGKTTDPLYRDFITKSFNQMVTHPKKNWSPHINGWYYTNMVHGSWTNDLEDEGQTNTINYKEFSPDAHILIPRAKQEMGHLIKEIDPTQLNIEYETISGRVRNIQNPTRIMGSSEFSITYKDNRDLDNFRYHEFWYDYIEAYKKGFISGHTSSNSGSPFIDIPFLNAQWIVLFKPFSFELQGLIKIMGITPTGLPIKEIIGQRSAPQMTTYTINYKAVDTISVIYGDTVQPSGKFYQEFLADSANFFKH